MGQLTAGAQRRADEADRSPRRAHCGHHAPRRRRDADGFDAYDCTRLDRQGRRIGQSDRTATMRAAGSAPEGGRSQGQRGAMVGAARILATKRGGRRAGGAGVELCRQSLHARQLVAGLDPHRAEIVSTQSPDDRARAVGGRPARDLRLAIDQVAELRLAAPLDVRARHHHRAAAVVEACARQAHRWPLRQHGTGRAGLAAARHHLQPLGALDAAQRRTHRRVSTPAASHHRGRGAGRRHGDQTVRCHGVCPRCCSGRCRADEICAAASLKLAPTPAPLNRPRGLAPKGMSSAPHLARLLATLSIAALRV